MTRHLSVRRSLAANRRRAFAKADRAVRFRKLLHELLENRALLAGSDWFAVFEGLSPGDDLEEQAQYGRNLLQSAGITSDEVELISALDLSGTFLIQSDADVSLESLTAALQSVPGFVYADSYVVATASDGSLDLGRTSNPKADHSENVFGPFDYYTYTAREQNGEIPDQSGEVTSEELEVLTNNNAGSSGTAFFTQSETTLVAFGNTVVVGFNDSGSNGTASNKFTGFARSTNSGTTFTDGGTLPTNPNGDAGDPVLARNDATGRLYYSTLQFSGSGINMFRSDDNGLTWQPPTQAAPGKNGFQDKQWHTVDNFAGPGNGNVYMIVRDFGSGNGIYFFRSTDHGNTFGPNGGTLIASGFQGAFVTVSPDHSVNAFWWAGSQILMRKSTNQGLTFGSPIVVASGLAGGTNGDLGLVGQNNGEAFNRTIRSNSFPHAVVNPVSGHIYVTYNTNPAGVDKGDVFLVISTNGGATWSPPVKVNDDLTTNDQWQPTLAVTPDGSKLGIFYYSRQEDTTTLDGDPVNNQFKYYGRIGVIAGSTVTFAPSFAVSDAPSKPEVGRDGVVNTTYMGDYDQAVATPGAFHVTWSDSRSLLPGGGTRMDPTVFYERIAVGLQVTTTIPAVGSTVATQPTVFTINVTEPLNPATVHASDLLVNGIPATSVAYTPGTTTVTFSYTVSPVTAQGSQTMQISAGAFNRAADGVPVDAFSGTFLYDAVALQVIATAPPFPGGVFTLPGPFTYDVVFNEPINPLSVQTSDLVLSGIGGAVVSGALVLPGNTTVRFTIGGISAEGTLTASIASGAILDAGGSAGAPFSASYQVDYGTVSYPPLTAKEPSGSLIYDPSISGTINFAGDVDSFTINLDPNQTLSIIVTPNSPGLQPRVELFNPFNASLGFAQAPAAGQIAGIQTAEVASGGLYRVAVAGANNTLGNYTVQVILNSAFELEGNVVGATNSTLATAQNINGSFIDLGETGSSAQRGAVLGSVQAGGNLITNGSFESGSFTGWTTTTTSTPFRPWAVTGPGQGGGFGMQPTAPQDGSFVAWNGFDGAGPMQFTMTQNVTLPSSPSLFLSWKDRLQWNFTLTPVSALARDYFVEVVNPVTGGVLATLYSFTTGPETVNPTGNTGWLSHSADLTAFAGSTVQLRFREVIPQASTGPGQAEFDAIALIVAGDADYYKFSLEAGETTTVALKALSGLGSGLGLAIFDASGAPIPVAVATAANLDRVATFTAGASGDYFARVTSTSGAISYSLVTTQSAAFDTEANDSFAAAQDINGVSGVLGSVSGTGVGVATSVLYATGNGGNSLIRIDQATGAATTVGSFGFSNTYAAAFTLDGTLWTIVDGFSTNARLATVNLATGAATPVGAPNWTGSNIIALEADAAGNLYAGNWNGTFFSVNKTTGQMTPIGPMNLFGLMDFTFDQSGVLWAVDGSNRLFRVNTTTGQGTFQTTITGVPTGSVMGMMVDPADSTFYVSTWTSPGGLYRLNTATGATTLVGTGLGSLPHGGDFSPPTIVTTTSTVVPGNLASLNGNSGNTFPLHSPTMRYQQIYSAGQFASGGIIDQVRFRRDSGQGAFTTNGINVQVNLSYAATTVGTASAIFANNIGAGSTLVFSGLLNLASSGTGNPNPFDIVIDVANTFNYNPALGDLLLEIRVFNSFPARFFDASGFGQQNSTTRIWAAGNVNATSGTVGSGTDPLPYGLVTRFDFASNPPEDWYSINVANTSQAINLKTFTPADGPGEFVNLLNPRIELYSPSNTLVASGIALPDGRNEFISYTPLVPGNYRVRVRGEGGTTGEYFLGTNSAHTSRVSDPRP